MAGQLPEGVPLPQDGSLDPSVSFGASSRTFSAYVHIPFCSVRCGYCDFNTYTSSELGSVSQQTFTEHLTSEIHFSEQVLARAQMPSRSLRTVFFGGGTPTLLPSTDLISVLATLRNTFGFATDCEITTEANPDTLTVDYAEELARAGFTRVSIGMQSAVEHVLHTLDRTHKPENVSRAVAAARHAGLDVSVDVIYGTPTESLDDWKRTVEQVLSLDVSHISAYALIVEQGTALERKIRSGHLPVPDDDLQADMYEYADSAFNEAGYSWYELSNWSKSDLTQSRHNTAYWLNQDWWGYGPGAHSHIGGQRFWNVKHPSAYVERLVSGDTPVFASELPDEQSRRLEEVLLRIRLASGLPADQWPPLITDELTHDGLIETEMLKQGRLVLSVRGRLRADEVVRRLTA
jgi:putative oxygen-independent coproporphyrinogen III oxidase